MRQIDAILASRQFNKHDGRALWKYNLSDNEFFHLRKAIMEAKRLNDLDARDCTLYYAEWWKRCYNGGSASKKEVFNSFTNGQWYDEEAFFEFAKKGAILLGIRWIKSQNTLFFRTLLLQGGLPVKHIAANKGAYKNFLLKILELNPERVTDFALDANVTKLLPPTSQNEIVYECCLNIVKAIINEDATPNNDDKEYLNLLAGNRELNEISSELRIKRQSLIFKPKKARWRTTWMFEPAQGQVRLDFTIPNMNSEEFKTEFRFNEQDTPLDFEYKLYYNNTIFCKFVKKENGHFRNVQFNQSDLMWDGSEGFPEIYLKDVSGNKHDCKHLLNYLPSLDKPSLWTKYSDTQWTLEKGRHTTYKEGFVLYPNNLTPNVHTDIRIVSLFGRDMKWTVFTDAIVLSNHTEQYRFRTNSKKIEWYIADNKPIWMQKASLPVVRKKPLVVVYDGSENLVTNPVLNWRQKATGNVWNNWGGTPMPHGLMELQIQAGDVTEYDEFFNIGNVELNVASGSLHEAVVELLNNTFLFLIQESPLVKIERLTANKLLLELNDNSRIPNAIQASLKYNNQNKSLRFEILPPFKGVEMLDNEHKVLPNGQSFSLASLNGFRLMSNAPNLVINLYNKDRWRIIITKSLTKELIPLRNFEEDINQLYSFSDPMDGQAEVVMEICEENFYRKQKRLREYRIIRYNQKLEYRCDENNKLSIQTKPVLADLFAAPLDCSLHELQLCELQNNEGIYAFKNAPAVEKYVVFSGKDIEVKIQPAFISVNTNNQSTTPEERLERIINYKNELLSAAPTDEIWQRFLAYYTICLNNTLPYCTFDILRSIGFSSELAAKSFVFLTCYDDAETFTPDSQQKFELEVGLSFHWTGKAHWHKAIEWIGGYSNPELIPLLSSAIKGHFQNLSPANYFSQIANYITGDVAAKIEADFFLNGRISKLRESLGARVLDVLPEKSPKIPADYKYIIPVNETNENVKILLKSPLSVALSIAGKDEALWGQEPLHEHIRRNVKYCHQLHPEWYSEAIIYCLTKLNLQP